jgi:cytochrome c peroxidase
MHHPRSLRRTVAWVVRLVCLSGLAALTGCGGGASTTVRDDTGSSAGWTWVLPSFFPTPKVPETNTMSAEKVDLGRYLFYDRRLSGNGMQACASCHQQAKAFTDGLKVSLGSIGEFHPRNAQSIANVVYNPTLTWANPSLVTLEKQMEVPLFGTDPVEMGVTDRNKDEVLARLVSDSNYQKLFTKAYPGQASPVSWGNLIHAIASFQRSILSGDSPYDRYLKGTHTLTAAETRGMNLFFGEKAECFHCHSSFNFNDQIVHAGSRIVDTPFHNTGLYNVDGKGSYPEPNRGVYELTQLVKDMGAFRAPSLRNVEVTAPYMHDGSIATLEEVLNTYAAGGRNITEGPHQGDGRANPFKNDFINQIALDAQERADIIAFLKTLTDQTLLTNPKLADPFATTQGGQ